ncbi:hypothetical protein AAFF_G00157070 [Aldrovandia affinis]|uniref:Transcriptional-regulating factor 1-like n=1 Tax=Aldrovandia affinis TaxID=143900 RepID=A0AAD7RNI9_9TELE|nr:hypothetical protein AAFF_G00157070 [Aldrovandia affinis]
MGDQTATEPQDSPPFQAIYYPLMEGQRPGQHFCHDALKELGQFGPVVDTCGAHSSHGTCSSSSSSVCSGRSPSTCAPEDNGIVSSWISHPLIHTQVDFSAGRFGGGAGRGRSQSDGHLPKWRSAYRHQGALGRGGGACEQKLDSFTEAFAKWSPSVPQVQNGGRGCVFGTILGLHAGGVNSGLDATGVVANSSAPPSHLPPLLLSPPPLSPPRRTHLPALQVEQSMHDGVPCSSAQFSVGLQTYYPPQALTHSPGPALAGKRPHLDWAQQPGDQMGNGDACYPHLQDRDSDPSLVYPGEEEYGLRHASSGHHNDFRSTDQCNLQTPLSSPQGQYPQSCVSFQPDCDPMTSTDHVTSWCQEAPDRGTPLSYTHPLPPCSMPPLPHPHGDGFRPVDGGKQYFGSQMTVSGAQCPTKVKNGSHLSYTRLPFPSILQVGRALEAVCPGAPSHYTPRPMLNPIRRGTGLYCNLLPLSYLQSYCSNQGSLWPEESCLPLPRVNLGPGFQAELPQWQECRPRDLHSGESPMEELFWKPWEELEESSDLQEQVENLLDLCSSSAIPGGGTNLELALHCLSCCQGDMLATVEMLLLSTPSSADDYHYCGSDVWTLSERRLFNKAFSTHSKDFSLIQKMVKTKHVSQCVEFYYLSKKIPEQQQKQREREKVEEEERTSVPDSNMFPISNTTVKPLAMEGAILSPSLATSFPCKQCGKMFYKIKSRNAHMKIHRQQQEDWRDRAHPSQILTHNATQSLPQTPARLAFLQAPNNHISSISNTNPNPVTNATALPLFAPPHPTWDAFELTPDPGTFYYDPEGKVMLGMAGGPKSQIRWQ